MNERPLKFRIYSFTDKLWHYFDIYEGYPQGIYGAVTPPQQFTGFLDKNGKEIYEGDIVHKHFKTNDIRGFFLFEVKWQDQHCGFGITKGNNHYYEVIGNIIENKELLQK